MIGAGPTAALATALGANTLSPAGAEDHVDGIRAELVVRPRSPEAVRQAVEVAAAHGLLLVASGRGRHLDMGAPPARCDLLLRLDLLDRVLEHRAEDLTVTVEAGCTLADLDRRLAAAGQWLPIDPPSPGETTVGGAIAAHLAGPLRASQGTVRDLLLGIETVSGEGRIVRGGGKVVKNVAGYDLPRLHVGALGSLGVILSATLKTRPRPPVERAIETWCTTPRAACDLALDIRDAAEPFWLELVSGDGGPATAVLAAWAGIAEEAGDGVARGLRAVARAGRDGREVPDAAGRRAELAGFALQPAAAILRVSTLPDRTGAALEAIAAAAHAAGAGVLLAAHAASGIARAAVFDEGCVPTILCALRRRDDDPDASHIVERATPAAKRRLTGEADPWGDPGAAAALARGVKHALDPAGILATGRLAGGL